MLSFRSLDDANRSKLTVADGTFSEESGLQEGQLAHIPVLSESVSVSVMDANPTIYER